MKVKSKLIYVVKRADGTNDIETKDIYEDIPDLGRHHIMCNKCGAKEYPDCTVPCPFRIDNNK